MGNEPTPYGVEEAARTLALVSRQLEWSLDEMTMPQFRVLSLIERSPERAGQIAARASLTRPSMTGLIDGLVAQGWVRRVDVAGDRRGVRIEITAPGRRALQQATKQVVGQLQALCGFVEADDRRRILEGIESMNRALVAQREHRERQHGDTAEPRAKAGR